MSDRSGSGPLMGRLRAYWLATVVCTTGFLFGYDSGIVGGVLTLASYEDDYRYGKAQATRTSSLAVGLQQGGAFVACFIIWPLTRKYGRKWPLIISSLVFCVGAIIETINTHSLAAFYVGRVVAGLGLGGATVVTPIYNSEMAPREMRGQVGCFFQLFYTIGIFISYWVDYGVAKDMGPVTKQWQIPVGLQILPAGLVGLGTLTLRESTRWYTKMGKHEEAWESLKWIRASDAPAVEQEMEEIRQGVAIEAKDTEGFRLTELLHPPARTPAATAVIVFCAQQSTGATAFAYFAPQYFKLLVGNDATRNLLITGIFGAIKVLACGTFTFLLSERVGRRTALVWGAAGMAACHFIVAGIVHNEPASTDGAVTSAGMATVAFIYLFVMIYNCSWGALPWPYVSEIFTARYRDPGTALGVSTQWLFNFVYTISTPYMIASMGWGTFLLWGIFNAVIAIGSWLGVRETRGLALETINKTYDAALGAKEADVERLSDAGSDSKGSP